MNKGGKRVPWPHTWVVHHCHQTDCYNVCEVLEMRNKQKITHTKSNMWKYSPIHTISFFLFEFLHFSVYVTMPCVRWQHCIILYITLVYYARTSR